MVKNFATPFDDMDYYDRPDLITAFGSNHENFYIIGDGVFYHYHPLPPSHPQYNASDTSPKWEYLSMPLSPSNLRGPYDPYVSDVWVHDYDKVFMLVSNPGAGTQLMYEWDGHDWTDGDLLPTSSLIRGIWGLGPNDIFAVGIGATILHYDGVDWTEFNNIGLDRWNSYTDIYGTSHSNLYVVGDASTTSSQLIRYDGEYWTGMDVPTYDGLGSITGWGAEPHTVYLAGYEGGIYQYLDAVAGQEEHLGWMNIPSDYPPAIYAYASDGNTIYMGGSYWPSGDISATAILSVSSSGSGSVIDVKPEGIGYAITSIAVTDTNLYASGWTTSADLYIAELSKTGGAASYLYDTYPDANISIRKIAVDSEGNIILGGLIEGSLDDQTYSGQEGELPEGWNVEPHAFDAFVVKYSPTGERIWSQIFGAPDEPRPLGNHIGERIERILIDKNGDIVVAGFTYTPNGFMVGGETGISVTPKDIGGDGSKPFTFVIKFDPDGTPLAANAWDTECYSISMEESSDGYYISGSSYYAEYGDDIVNTGQSNLNVMRLDENLNEKWSRYIGVYSNQWIWSSAVTPDDSIYITGSTVGSFGGHNLAGAADILVTKLSGEGVIQGSKVLGGTQNEVGRYITVNQYGSPMVYATTDSIEIAGSTAGDYGFIWSDIEIETDPYAECRLFYR